MKQTKKQSGFAQRFKSGVAITTTIAAAAALAAAAFHYLKQRGYVTKQNADRLAKRAKSANSILRGESKQAFEDIRAVITDELLASGKPITRASAERAAKDVLAALKLRGAVTAAQSRQLLAALMTDWQTMQREAKKRRGA